MTVKQAIFVGVVAFAVFTIMNAYITPSLPSIGGSSSSGQ